MNWTDRANILRKIRNGDSTIYDYDSNSQVIAAEYPNGLEQEFTYDDAGNRTRLVESGTRTTDITCTYNSANQLTEMSNGGYAEYDKMGNMVEYMEAADSDIWTYEYFPENRLKKVEKDEAVAGRYAYNFRGRRLRSESTENTLAYLWDNDFNLIADLGTDYSALKKYITGTKLDEYIMQIDENTEDTLFFVQARVNSVVGLLDEEGGLTGTAEYEAFGAISDSTGMCAVRALFTGREIDIRTGLYYYRVRWYCPNNHEFTSPDPFEFSPAGLNLYWYVQNNPLIYTDALGLEESCTESIIEGVVWICCKIANYCYSKLIGAANVVPASPQNIYNSIQTCKPAIDSLNAATERTKTECDSLLSQ